MRKFSIVALFVLVATGFSSGQQATQSTPVLSSDMKLKRVKVYAIGQDVTSPELLQHDLSLFSTNECGEKLEGHVLLSLLVDKAGKPRNIMVMQPLWNDLDRYALKIVEADRFRPGTHDGVPVVVSQSVEVGLKSCVVETKGENGKKDYKLLLTSQPEQRFGGLPRPPEGSRNFPKSEHPPMLPVVNMPGVYQVGGEVKAPVVVNTANAEFSEEARSAKYSGTCYVSLIVDSNGMPQNVQVVRALGMGLDEKAIEAVRQYRFKPGMKNSVPVPVEIMVEVNFRLF